MRMVEPASVSETGPLRVAWAVVAFMGVFKSFHPLRPA
jgi:hypothetical protein